MRFGVFNGVMLAKVREAKEKARLEKQNRTLAFADERRVDDYDNSPKPPAERKPTSFVGRIGTFLLAVVTCLMAAGIVYLIYLGWRSG